MSNNEMNNVVARIFLSLGFLTGLAIEGVLFLVANIFTDKPSVIFNVFFTPNFKDPFAHINVFPLIWYAGLVLILFCLVGFVCTFKQREKLS